VLEDDEEEAEEEDEEDEEDCTSFCPRWNELFLLTFLRGKNGMVIPTC
jgi:hypothetical protein